MYDAGTRPDRYLRAYAREFATVEIDSTFYGTPPPERVRAWLAAVPPSFTFALKVPREITHDRRLIGCDALLADFIGAALGFGAQLEGVLLQLPPDFAPGEIDALLGILPRLREGIRWTVEVRDPAWFGDPLPRLRDALGVRNIALAVTDGTFVPLDVMLAQLAAPTATHAYLRWLGARDAVTRFDRVLFDRSAELRRWAEALRGAAPRLERASGYVNNHYAGHSPAVVRAFYAELGVPHAEPAHPADFALLTVAQRAAIFCMPVSMRFAMFAMSG
jgi:uncharacterized protein YecE (DUF72 family)